MTKQTFLDALRREILARYAWAGDAAKLERYMAAAARSCGLGDAGQRATINGDAWRAAWSAIGGKGRPTYKALAALPA